MATLTTIEFEYVIMNIKLLSFGLMFSCSSSLGRFLGRPTERFGVTMGRAATGRGDGVGCGLLVGLKYALIVAAIVSEVEISRRTSCL